MATHALTPAPPPANHDRAAFNLAAARCRVASITRDALPTTSDIHAEIAAGEALERAQAMLTVARAPDLPTFATKLRLTLQGAGVAADLIDALADDVVRLARKAESRA